MTVASCAFSAAAIGSPIDEIEWATVGSPGNAPFVIDYGGGFEFRAGAVDHEFRIAKTEVTGAQWLEFVEAYAPFVDPEYANNSEFESWSIIRLPGPTPGSYQYYLPPVLADRPVEAGWRYGARFVNWLHNGRANNREAFEAGVYDTSTFGDNPDGTITDQAERSPGSTYFLVSRDEWVKAGFFDPNRYGEGQPGYWMYPNGSDTPPVGGPPGEGGETGAGYYWPGLPPPVGAYPDTQSPWGVLDLSGGVREWTETLDASRWRFFRGSYSGALFPYYGDEITHEISVNPRSLYGFRIGTPVVPSPTGVVVMVMVLAGPRRVRCN